MSILFPNLRHLRAFKVVAEHKSVSAGAERVYLSQPAVTQAIAGLERNLGITLFDRQPAGMFLTSLGKGFLLRVQRMFTHLEEGAILAIHAGGRDNKQAKKGFYTQISASQLRALVAIWETGNFSLAARKIGVSQPSVYRAGRDLEKLAGIQFFIATRKGIELTDAAEHFARGTKLAAAELQQGYDEITLSKGTDSTKIRVGSMPLSRTSILPQAIHALLAGNEGVQIFTTDGHYEDLLKGLRYGDLDILIGALRSPSPTEDILQEHLFNDPLAVVAGPKHPLVGCEKVTLAQALEYPWIAPPKSTPSGSYLYKTIGIATLKATPVRIVSSSLVLIRGLLARGDYVTIMSRNQMAIEYEQGLMVPLKIELPDSARSIGLTFRKEWRPTPTQKQFLELLRAASNPDI
ncbi:MAG: LysR family transcriptional regulator [Paracoccaceae bacterium]